jgi:hypothetical protein
MAEVLTLNIDGATVKFRDDCLRSREESEEILQRVADRILIQLNVQYNAGRFKEMQEMDARLNKTAE